MNRESYSSSDDGYLLPPGFVTGMRLTL